MLVLTTGCTSIRPQSVNSERGRALINDRADRQAATLTFESGRSVEAQNLHVSVDSLTWVTVKDKVIGRTPLSEVATISFYTRRNAIRNAALGFVTGAAIGYVAGHSSDPGFPLSRESAAMFGALGTGLLAAVLGALIGIDRMNRDVYTVEPPDE